MDAIRLYTTHSTCAGFEEALEGSIEPGRLADLVVPSEDPFENPPDGLTDVRVVKTLIGGEVAHAMDP